MSADEEYEPSPSQWVRDQVELYEGSDGAQGTTLRDTGLAVVIVTNRGAKSGKIRKTPVMRVEHDGKYAAVASQGGAPTHPYWYHNLTAHPQVTLRDGASKTEMTAREVSGAERDEWWERAVAAYPPYADYQKKTTRIIPVFVLEPADLSFTADAAQHHVGSPGDRPGVWDTPGPGVPQPRFDDLEAAEKRLDIPHLTSRHRDDHVASGGKRTDQHSGNATGGGLLDQVQHHRQDQARRDIQVNHGAELGGRQQRLGLGQVSVEESPTAVLMKKRLSVATDGRVMIYVRHPRPRTHRVHERQAGAHVDELPDAAGGRVSGRPADELPVVPQQLRQVRAGCRECDRQPAVSGEIMASPEQVVVGSRQVRPVSVERLHNPRTLHA